MADDGGANLTFTSRAHVVLCLSLASLSLSSCTSGAESEGEQASTTTSITAGSGVSEAEVVRAYEDFWLAFLEASDPPNPDNPELAMHAVGDELARVQAVLSTRGQANEAVRGSYAHSIKVIRVDDLRAELADCLTADTAVYDVTSGAEVSREPPVGQPLQVSLEKVDDVWKVALIEQGDVTCDESQPQP